MKIYISGPMTDVAGYNKPAFFKADLAYTQQGFTVLHPAILPSSNEISHDEYMIISLAMLSICEAIYMLQGWENSKGAKIEHAKAKKIGLFIYYEAD